MRFPSFFIDRPIVAAVLSIVILLAGVMSLGHLPLSEYPAVTPPTVMVRASYPGASPETIAETVAAPIEQEVNGTDGLLYMSSQSTVDGSLSLTPDLRARGRSGHRLDPGPEPGQPRGSEVAADRPADWRRHPEDLA